MPVLRQQATLGGPQPEYLHAAPLQVHAVLAEQEARPLDVCPTLPPYPPQWAASCGPGGLPPSWLPLTLPATGG